MPVALTMPSLPAAQAVVAPAPTISLAAPADGARLQTAAEALVQDAREYANANAVPLAEAVQRLRAQQESITATDALQEKYRDRLAGVAIEHSPIYRIIVLLTGTEPVPDQTISAGGMDVPVLFRTGAVATRAQMLDAITDRRSAILAAVGGPAGMGIDQRNGALLVTLKSVVLEGESTDALAVRLTEVAGVPVRVRVLDMIDRNLAAEGGSRVEGVDTATGRRFACTTGFVVTDATRTGVTTAAHCPYTLTYYGPGRQAVPLTYVGAWGARFQDVQVQVSGEALRPIFYADTAKTVVRPVTSWRNRTSTRAGDVVCHRGERTGYSCAQVELIDYAPPGDLCGGPCEPVWVTVAGPSCKGGDSGGPVFSGTIAFGILKGGSYRRDGTCNFYYYMSTDYLPDGWSLLHD